MAFTFDLIPKDNIIAIWPEIAHFAKKLEKRSHGRFIVADIFHQIAEDPYFVWVVRDEEGAVGFFICGVKSYPRKTYLDLNTLSGVRLKEWMGEGFKMVEDFAIELGMDGLETSTAPAMEKIWKDLGFTKEFIVMTKPVENKENNSVDKSDLLSVNADELLKEVANGR